MYLCTERVYNYKLMTILTYQNIFGKKYEKGIVLYA